MNESVWVGDQFSSPEDFYGWEKENQHRILSPSRISAVSSCPRKYQHQYIDIIRKKDTPDYMNAGGMLHTGIDHWYQTKDIDASIELMREGDYPDPGPDSDFLQLPSLEIIVRNYGEHWTKHEAYTPIEVPFEDLNLDSVLAARWRTTDEGLVILAESPLMMIVEDLILVGVPDMPVKSYSGNNFVMDHKSTKGYISNYWKGKYRISDQFRIYNLMMMELLGIPFQGVILDAIYMGKYATSVKSKATKFDRDEYYYDATMLEETIKSAKSWLRQIEGFKKDDYFPQSTGLYCGGCFYLDICKEPVWAREVPKDSEKGEPRSILAPR